MRASAESLRQALEPVDAADDGARAAAAVLVLLRPRGEDLEVLLGRRASREGDPWSGHIGLPGGRRHATDASLLETALRETREEVGLDVAGRADLLGRLAARSPANDPGMRVVPFVALARGDVDADVSAEMEEVFWVPLEELPPTRARATVDTRFGPLDVPAFLWRDRIIWGFTYRVLEDLLALAGVTRAGPSAPSGGARQAGASPGTSPDPGGSARTPRR